MSWPSVAVIFGPGVLPLSVNPSNSRPDARLRRSLPGDEVDLDVRLALGIGHEVLDAGAARMIVSRACVRHRLGPPP